MGKLSPENQQRNRSHGQYLSIPASRLLVIDYLRIASRIPSQSLYRDCDFSLVRELRRRQPARVGWAAIFVKAFALMARHHPDLWCRYTTWPWSRRYQQPEQRACICISRTVSGADWLFVHGVTQPEDRSLVEIQGELERVAKAPVEEIPEFQMQMRFARYPAFVRRLCWSFARTFPRWAGLAARGSYGVTSVSPWGATSMHPPTLGFPILTYGPVDAQGFVRVTIVYDHRLFDGATIARFLSQLDDVVQNLICEELGELMNCQVNLHAA